eukprot:1156066-Pelagomonas_calceolata.AAC.5
MRRCASRVDEGKGQAGWRGCATRSTVLFRQDKVNVSRNTQPCESTNVRLESSTTDPNACPGFAGRKLTAQLWGVGRAQGAGGALLGQGWRHCASTTQRCQS